jgi:hypothetical protein
MRTLPTYLLFTRPLREETNKIIKIPVLAAYKEKNKNKNKNK